MWWLFMDIEDAGKILIIILIVFVLGFVGWYIFGGRIPNKHSDKYEVVYDTISKNDSVLVLKTREVLVKKDSTKISRYDTISYNNNILVLKVKK